VNRYARMYPARHSVLPLLLLLLTLAATAKALHGQDPDPQYLSAILEPTTRKKATYYRVANGRQGQLYAGAIHTMDGKLKAKGTYRDEALTIEHGMFEFYHANGEVESRGEYQHGRKSGVWERYTSAGVPLAEKIYDPEPLENIVYTRAQVMPRYTEGDERVLVRYIKERVNNQVGHRTKAKVTASFVVEKSGALSDIVVTGGKSPGVDKQVAEAIQSTAPWEPGMERGLPVRVQMRLPVQF
jgi:hypothetical protein